MTNIGKKWQRLVQRLKALLKPKNVIRTLISVAPGSGPFLEMDSQLEGAQLDERIGSLEETDLTLHAKLSALESKQPKPTPQREDWIAAAQQYLQRVADIVVIYDAVADSPPRPGREVFLDVAHGCFVGPKAVLTSVEAIRLAKGVAKLKRGRLGIVAGMNWYTFELAPIDELSGLVICNITARDEKRWSRTKSKFLKAGFPENMLPQVLETPVATSVYPWMGQDVGFFHTGEAVDVMREGIAKYQFEKTSISHFRNVREDALKTFVTGVLSSRICKSGSPVFDGGGTLLGVIADTERYESDAGRRAVVRSLLGHPRFTVFSKKTA